MSSATEATRGGCSDKQQPEVGYGASMDAGLQNPTTRRMRGNPLAPPSLRCEGNQSHREGSGSVRPATKDERRAHCRSVTLLMKVAVLVLPLSGEDMRKREGNNYTFFLNFLFVVTIDVTVSNTLLTASPSSASFGVPGGRSCVSSCLVFSLSKKDGMFPRAEKLLIRWGKPSRQQNPLYRVPLGDQALRATTWV